MPLPWDLSFLDEPREVLAEARTIDQIKSIRDSLEALRQYARSNAVGLEVQNRAARLRLLLERKAGRLLARLHLQGGDRKSTQHAKRLRLKELGISHSQSARWQREAAVPREVFQRYLRETVAQGRELTSLGLLEVADAWRDGPEVAEPGWTLAGLGAATGAG